MLSLFRSDLRVHASLEKSQPTTGALESAAMPLFASRSGSTAPWSEWSGTEEPRTRLVGWQQYVGALFGKSGLYSAALAIGFLGMVILAFTFYDLVHDTFTSHGQVNTLIFLLSESIIMGGLGVAAIWCSKFLSALAKSVESVAPITRHNTGSLPEIETLVRASDLPRSHRQAELLRAACKSQETPPQELLRAR